MSDMYGAVQQVRDESGLGAGLVDDVLFAAARSGARDEAGLRHALAVGGVTLPAAALRELVTLIRMAGERVDGARPGRHSSAAPGPPGPDPVRAARFPYLTLVRHRGRPHAAPAAVAGPSAGPAVAPPKQEGSMPRPAGTQRNSPRNAQRPMAQRPTGRPAGPPTGTQVPVGPGPGRTAPEEVEAATAAHRGGGTDADVEAGRLAQEFNGTLDIFGGQEAPLQVRAQRGRLALTWAPAPPEAGNVRRYLVVAHPSRFPDSPNDGDRLVGSAEARIDVPGGAGPFFSVFLYAGEDLDRARTQRAVPHATGRLLPEVSDLSVQATTDSVVLGWVVPPGVGVEVQRSAAGERVPRTRDPALLIPVVGDFAQDADIEPGAVYEYRIMTRSTAILNGSMHQEVSPGVVHVVTIPVRPRPVSQLTASVRQRDGELRVDLSWPVLDRGTVRIHQVAGVPQHAGAGRVLSLEQLEMLGIGLPIRMPAPPQDGQQVMRDVEFPSGDGPRRTYTPVTVIGEQYCVGEPAVVDHIGDPSKLEMHERVDRQFLRFSWPPGATFVAVRQGAVGGDLTQVEPRLVSRQDFDTHGGLHLGQLPMEGCDLSVQGAIYFRGEWKVGGIVGTHYPGRWVAQYRLERQGLLGGDRRMLMLRVERPWPPMQIFLMGSHDRVPLTGRDPNCTVLTNLTIPGGALPRHEWCPVGEVRVGTPYARLFVYAEGITPIVLDEIPEDFVRLVQDNGRRGNLRFQQDRTPPTKRCQSCLQSQPVFPQLFRCVGTCAEVPDPTRSGFLQHPVSGRPLLAVGGQEDTATNPVDHVVCNKCKTTSFDQTCRLCHATLAASWAVGEPLAVTLVGARSTGKTTYVSVLMRSLESVVAPALGGLITRVSGPADQADQVLQSGSRVFQSTRPAGANDLVYAPRLLQLTDQSGGSRSLALFDAAGEDMESDVGVRQYGFVLASTDAIVFLVDPLQIQDVRILLDGRIPLPPVATDPSRVLQNIVTELRTRRSQQHGPLPGKLAVVLSKFDGLQMAMSGQGTELSGRVGPGSALMRDPYALRAAEYSPADGELVHQDVRSLLIDLKATGFLRLAESSFNEVRFFAVSALGHGPDNAQISEAGVSPFRVVDPLRWLLASRSAR